MDENGNRSEYGTGGVRYRADRDVWIAAKSVEDGRGRKKRIEGQGPTKTQAIAERDKKIRDFIRGKQKTKGKGTVAEWLEKWMNEIAVDNVRPTTLKSYASAIKYQIVPTIGHMKLKDLEPADVRFMRKEVVNSYLDKKKGVKGVKPRDEGTGARRARYAQVVLSKALADAVTEEILDRNVADSAYVKKTAVVAKPQKALNAEQAKHLLRTSIENRDRYASRWATALITGTRQGEVLGLTWDRVDFTRKEIHFTRQLQVLENEHGCGEQIGDRVYPCGMKVPRACPERKFKVTEEWRDQIDVLEGSLAMTPTKTKMSARALPMPAPLEQILRAHQLDTAGEPNPHNLVWHQENGKPIQPRADYEAWVEALDKAGLDRIKLHSTRHSAASIMSDMGIDRQVIMQILGHTNLNTTAGYAAVGDSFRREALGRMGGLLDLFSAAPREVEGDVITDDSRQQNVIGA
ncbi:tyrosine integrase [Gordonia phage Bantam]|uniref:Integrase n=1 Tax=Gordonia phage Bantam TaxID=1887641 RepID=A0A1B3AYD4_9CAUD|nr:integrase [Gordonia phage Bantam]AOE43753.1 tyrosine integrase [Gordonia phage Bantam]